MFKFRSSDKQYFYEPDFRIMNSFGSPNSLMIPAPEPQTIDSHNKTNLNML